MYFVPRGVHSVVADRIYGVLGPRSLDPTVNRWLLPHGIQGDPIPRRVNTFEIAGLKLCDGGGEFCKLCYVRPDTLNRTC